MKLASGTIVLCAVGVLALWGDARADLFNSRPVTPMDNGFEPTLQEVFNGITPGGPGVINALSDQINNAIFTNVGGGSTATMLIEIAGFAQKNTFGIYSFADPSRRVTIFNGAAAAGDVATIQFDPNGSVTVDTGGRPTVFNSVFGPGGRREFGFFITTPERNVFFSEDSRNLAGGAQSLIYQGDDQTALNLGGDIETFDSDEFIIAFEDLVYARSDRDFQDLVVFVDSVTPVPVPVPGAAALGILGLGLAGLVRKRLS